MNSLKHYKSLAIICHGTQESDRSRVGKTAKTVRPAQRAYGRKSDRIAAITLLTNTVVLP